MIVMADPPCNLVTLMFVLRRLMLVGPVWFDSIFSVGGRDGDVSSASQPAADITPQQRRVSSLQPALRSDMR